ncbi:MAG TPA: type II secretion system secretin GspD [Alphaproteobacteria bacterium]|nr:type II secretion system secretin GspD [Alphaproteobacteria bacterium]
MSSSRFPNSLPLLLAAALALGACERTTRPLAALQPPPEPAAPAAGGQAATPQAGAQPGGPLAAQPLPQGPAVFGGGARPRPVTVASSGAGQAQPRGDITLNFDQADIRDVVQVMLGELLGRNYVVAPEVQGTVTLQTNVPLTREAVLPTLRAVLEARGARLVEGEGVIQVVPAGRAVAARDVVVFPLAYIGAEAMRNVLAPLVEGQATVSAEPGRRLLVVAGTPEAVALARRTVAAFDIDQLTGSSALYVPVREADATVLAGELEAVLGGGARGPLADQLRIVPVERLNALLVVADAPAYLDQAREWVSRLDRRDAAGERRARVYYVRYGKAADLAKTLRAAFGGGESVAVATAAAPAPGGEAAEGEAGAEGGGAPTATAVASSGGGGGPRIVADLGRNALVIYGTGPEYRAVEEALAALDVAPTQVMIEASIVEVALNDQLRYGVQYFIGTGGLGITEGGRTILSTGSSAAGIAPTLPGFGFSLTSGADARVVVDALDSVTDLKVLSSPQLLVLDNQSARLQVGDEVPIVTQQATSTVTQQPQIVQSITYRETGVTLEVRPHVGGADTVTLEIAQEVSDVARTTTSGIDSPTIQQRRVISTVNVGSGDMVLLGGLIRERNTTNQTGVPGLSSIPVVGALFGSTGVEARRTELLVLITPRLLRSREQARDMTRDLRNRFLSVLNWQADGAVQPRPPRPLP